MPTCNYTAYALGTFGFRNLRKFSNGNQFQLDPSWDAAIDRYGLATTFGTSNTSFGQNGPNDFINIPALLPFYADINVDAGGDIYRSDGGSDAAYAGPTDGNRTSFAPEFSGNSSPMHTYGSNDFDNGDPAGTSSFSAVNLTADVFLISRTSPEDTALSGLGAMSMTVACGKSFISSGARPLLHKETI